MLNLENKDLQVATNNNPEHWKVCVLLLKEIAAHKGLTIQAVADRAGLHRSNVSRTFALTYCPTLPMFLKIAQAVGVNFFFEDQDSDTPLNVLFEQAMDQLNRRPDKT